MKFVEDVLGAGLTLLILTEVFLTVLYARADTGLISSQLAHSVFAVFRSVSKKLDTEGTPARVGVSEVALPLASRGLAACA